MDVRITLTVFLYIIYFCALQIKCDHSPLITQNDNTQMTIKFGPDSINELVQRLYSLLPNIDSTYLKIGSSEKTTSTFPSVPSFLTFPSVPPTMQPVFEAMRSYIKTGYKSFHFHYIIIFSFCIYFFFNFLFITLI